MRTAPQLTIQLVNLEHHLVELEFQLCAFLFGGFPHLDVVLPGLLKFAVDLIHLLFVGLHDVYSISRFDAVLDDPIVCREFPLTIKQPLLLEFIAASR